MLRPKLRAQQQNRITTETMRIGLSSRSQSAKKGYEAAHECKRLTDQAITQSKQLRLRESTIYEVRNTIHVLQYKRL